MQKFWQSVWFDLTHITFKGRASKKEYLYWFLFNILFTLAIWLFVSLPASMLTPLFPKLSTAVQLTLTVYFFASILISVGFGIWKALADLTVVGRRFHDFGKSAWFALFWYWLIALVVVIFVSIGTTVLCAGVLHLGKSVASVISITFGQVVMFIFWLYYVYLCLFKKGDEGENQYGLPKENV